MVQTAILSDIHGNLQALAAVLAEVDRRGIEDIISIGDNIGYGPQPDEVTRILIDRGICSVMGNHEFALINEAYFRRLNPGPQQSLALTRILLSDASRAWLRSLPPVLLRHGGRFVHGCPPDSMTAYLFNPTAARLQRLFLQFSERWCFIGHTHSLAIFTMHSDGSQQQIEQVLGEVKVAARDRHIIVSGSVGQPRDLVNSKAKFLVWDPEGQSVEINAVEYDVERTVRLLDERGFPKTNAIRLQW